MSEIKNRFRIKSGEIEIEYEGPLKEVNDRYENVLEWLTSGTTKRHTPSAEKGKQKDDQNGRGGTRIIIYGPKIDELEKEDFFRKRKSLDEVIKGLVIKNVPTKGNKARKAILASLRRRIARKNAKLKGATEEDIWYFWTA